MKDYTDTAITRTGGLLPSNARNEFRLAEFQDLDAPIMMVAGSLRSWTSPVSGETCVGNSLVVRDGI